MKFHSLQKLKHTCQKTVGMIGKERKNYTCHLGTVSCHAGDFGGLIWGFGVLILDSGSWILGFGFGTLFVLDFGLWNFWILEFGILELCCHCCQRGSPGERWGRLAER